MKKLVTLLLSSIIMINFLSCDNATDVDKNEKIQSIRIWGAEGYLEEWDTNIGKKINYMEYPYFCLYPDDAEKYPELQKTLVQLCETDREERFERFKDSAEFLREFYAEDPDSYWASHYTRTKGTIRRADSKVVSILFHSMDYFGAVHGEYKYWGANIDVNTGEKLTLSDVVLDKQKLAFVVKEKLNEFYSDWGISPNIDIEKLFLEEKEISFTIDYNGLTIYFNPYVIAFSGTMTQIVTVSSEEHPGIIKDEYCSGFTSYCMELEDSTTYYHDVTEDGIIDEILYGINENDESKKLNIWINKECLYDEEIVCDDWKTSLVHLDNKQNILCVETSKDKDMHETMFIKLGERVEKIGNIDASIHQVKYQSGELWKTYDIVTDPSQIYIDSKPLDIILEELSD